jgi:hypothetical protein
MSETENAAGGLKTRINWAFALSIISLALTVILITALVAGARCHKKRTHGFPAHHGLGGAPGLQCPAGGPGGFKHAGDRGFGERRGVGDHQGRKGGNHGEKFASRLAAELNLDAGQQARIKQIIDDQKARIAKLDNPKPDDFKKIMEDGKARIRAVLKPDQQKKFDDKAAKFGPKRDTAQQ